MRLTMRERRVLTKAFCERYRKAAKKAKGMILNEFVEATEYNRAYAARLLRNHGRRVEVAPGRVVEGDVKQRRRAVRPKIYTRDVIAVLKKLWLMLDCICGKRLQPALPDLIERLEACKELRLKKAIRQKLLTMSAATIDRALREERARFALKGRSRTKPGTLLKNQIPVRTFAQWDEDRPGFVEMDLVAHDGGSSKGDYCQTLNFTDVASGWCEQAAVLNKAQIHVFAAIQTLRQRLPFKLLGLDSDNGSEFINRQLSEYCSQHQISFTRSRPYRKNDSCYVEQKNWSLVRRFAGYARFESAKACVALNDLYEALRDYNNFFMPSQKLKSKTRDGAHTRKSYTLAQSPYRRLLASPDVPESVKKQLYLRFQNSNPAQLRREIRAAQKKLETLARRPPQKATWNEQNEFNALVPI